MSKERFTETFSTGIVTDNLTGKEYNCEYRIDDELIDFLNKQDKQIQQLLTEIEDNIDGFKKCNRRILELIEYNLKDLLECYSDENSNTD